MLQLDDVEGVRGAQPRVWLHKLKIEDQPTNFFFKDLATNNISATVIWNGEAK